MMIGTRHSRPVQAATLSTSPPTSASARSLAVSLISSTDLGHPVVPAGSVHPLNLNAHLSPLKKPSPTLTPCSPCGSIPSPITSLHSLPAPPHGRSTITFIPCTTLPPSSSIALMSEDSMIVAHNPPFRSRILSASLPSPLKDPIPDDQDKQDFVFVMPLIVYSALTSSTLFLDSILAKSELSDPKPLLPTSPTSRVTDADMKRSLVAFEKLRDTSLFASYYRQLIVEVLGVMVCILLACQSWIRWGWLGRGNIQRRRRMRRRTYLQGILRNRKRRGDGQRRKRVDRYRLSRCP
ncbi:hypothetical protein BC829DRAFT_214282 [Chytridium lagenaria]|nr:hypothetical protein BC829DRAFT_214282 [Chytridium lagenaria]